MSTYQRTLEGVQRTKALGSPQPGAQLLAHFGISPACQRALSDQGAQSFLPRRPGGARAASGGVMLNSTRSLQARQQYARPDITGDRLLQAVARRLTTGCASPHVTPTAATSSWSFFGLDPTRPRSRR